MRIGRMTQIAKSDEIQKAGLIKDVSRCRSTQFVSSKDEKLMRPSETLDRALEILSLAVQTS